MSSTGIRKCKYSGTSRLGYSFRYASVMHLPCIIYWLMWPANLNGVILNLKQLSIFQYQKLHFKWIVYVPFVFIHNHMRASFVKKERKKTHINISYCSCIYFLCADCLFTVSLKGSISFFAFQNLLNIIDQSHHFLTFSSFSY